MLAPLMAKPQVNAAGPARARSALGRAGDRVHERRIDPIHATRSAPQTGLFFPSHKAPAAAWALGQIPVHPPGRRDAPGAAAPGMTAAAAPRPSAAAGKLKVGATNDPREHEADRVAERVMRAPEPAAAIAPAAPGATPPKAGRKRDDHKADDRKPDGHKHDGQEHPSKQGESHTPAGEAPAGVHETLSASGKPLDPAARAYFEPRLGRDLASVRVHADDKAAKSASSIGAHAYTAGDHVVLGEGKSAATPEGKRVMAHELTHVAQQKGEAPTVQRFPFPHPPAADAKQAAKPKASSVNSYIDLFNGFQDLASAAINRGGAGLDSAHFGGDLSAAHRALLQRVQFVLIEAQDDKAKRLAAAEAWPGLAGKLQEAVSEAHRWPALGQELAAVTDDIAMLGRSYVHAKAGKAEPEAESVGDYADSINGMNDLLWIFGRLGEAGEGLLREQVAGRKEVDTSVGVQSSNAQQRAELAKVKFGSRLNARHAKVLDTLRTALLLARSEEPGSSYKALVLWRSIEGDLRHMLARAPAFDILVDKGIETEIESAAQAMATHYEAVHRENVGVALTKPRTQEEVKSDRTIAKVAGPVAAAAIKDVRAVEDFQYALTIVEQHLTPSKDRPGEWVLTSGGTSIRVRADQAQALRATVAKQLTDYMAQLVKAMVRVWDTYDSIQRGNSPFKLAVLGGWGGATDPGDQSHFKDSLIRMRDGKIKTLVDQGQFVEAFKWILMQKGVVDRQAKEVNDYDSDLDLGYSRLAVAATVVQVALTALVPVAGEAALAGGAGVLAVGGTAVASGAVGAGAGEAVRQTAAGEDRDWGKIVSTARSGGAIGLSAVAAPATKGIANLLAPGAVGTTAVGVNAVASATFGGVQSAFGGGSFGEGAAGGAFGSLAGGIASKALGPLAENPLARTAIVGGVGAGVGVLTGADPTAAALGAIASTLIEGGGAAHEPTNAAGAKRARPALEPGLSPEPPAAGARPPAALDPPVAGVRPTPLELPGPRVQPPAIAGSEAVPLRSSYAPRGEEPVGAGRPNARARPFYAKDPKARPGGRSPRRVPFAGDPDLHASIRDLENVPGARRTEDPSVADEHPTVPEDRPEGGLFNRTQAEKDASEAALQRGNTFNTEREPKYKYNEIEVESIFEEDVYKKKGSRREGERKVYRVDSYDPDKGIISRKYPSSQSIDSHNGIKYIEELIDKYPPGAKIRDTPRSRALGLANKTLSGPPILEVPVLLGEVPEDVLALAHNVGVTIRDAEGNVYR